MPQDLLADGFVRVCISTDLNYYSGGCRILVEGQYVPNLALSEPITSDKPVRVTGPRYIDEMFTAGSVLAESLKMVLATCSRNNVIDLWALPRQDNAAGVKAVYQMTITGPATSDGLIDIFLGEADYSVEAVIVETGDVADTIAANIAAAIPTNFPYAVTVASNVITFTAINAGTVGNYLTPIVNWKVVRGRMPLGVSISTAQTIVGANDPAPLDYDIALGDCCWDVIALQTEDKTWQRGLRDYLRASWDCSKPQCFGHGYVYNSGSLGTILAAGDNSAELSRMAICPGEVNFPWLLNASYAAASACSACTNPEKSIQGRSNGVMRGIRRPQSCDLCWEWDELTQLQDEGFVTYTPLGLGQGLLTSPYVINDVTNYLYDELNRPNLTYRDASSRRLAKKTALAIAEQLQSISGSALYTKNTRVPAGVFGTNKRMILADMHRWFKTQVGTLFSEPENLEEELTIVEDFEIAPACTGVPCVLHMTMLYRPPCRTARFNVNMIPKVLDNCSRD